MDVIFEGRLSEQASIKEVLQQVFDQAHPGRTILRLTAVRGDDFTGRILISNGRHVVAASIGENQVLGYPALKGLLDRQDCSFALLKVSPNDNLDLGTTLNIDLMRIIMLLPDLPDSPAGLFDEKGLLDKLFGDFDEEPPGPSQPKMGPPATIIQSASQKAAFDMLEPFLSGGYPAADEDEEEDDEVSGDRDHGRNREPAKRVRDDRSRDRKHQGDESEGSDHMDFSPHQTPITPLSPVKIVTPQAMQENSSRLRQLAKPSKPSKRLLRIPYVPIASAFVIYMLTSLILAYLRPGFAESYSWSYSWATVMWDYLAPNRLTTVKQQTLAPGAPVGSLKLSWHGKGVQNERIFVWG